MSETKPKWKVRKKKIEDLMCMHAPVVKDGRRRKGSEEMRFLIEEKDRTQEYKPIEIETLLEMVKNYKDRVCIYVPNACGGETKITIFKEVKMHACSKRKNPEELFIIGIMVAVLALAVFALAVLVITKAENKNLGIIGLLLGVGSCMFILGLILCARNGGRTEE